MERNEYRGVLTITAIRKAVEGAERDVDKLMYGGAVHDLDAGKKLADALNGLTKVKLDLREAERLEAVAAITRDEPWKAGT